MNADRAKPPSCAAPSDRVDPALRRLTVTLIVGALAVIFDTTIMTVAIDNLAGQLHTSLADIQWVSTAYLLALATVMPAVGWLQAALGGKRLWIAALGLFFAGSLLCACAWNVQSLVGFRVVQGFGGGIMMVLMITLIMQAAKGRNIGKVMSLITVPTALGPVIGPVLGGLILHLGDWHWIFLFNVPFCVVGAWLAARHLPEDEPAPRPRLDVLGMLLLSPGIAAVLYGLTQLTGSDGLTSPRVALPLFAGLALLLGYLGWALRRGPDALINIRLFRHRALASSSVLVFLSGAALYSTMLLLPLYWQQVRGESALGAALLLIPQGVGTLLSRALAGRYMDRFGPRPVALAAFALTCAATAPFGFVTASTSNIALMTVLFVRGVGLGAAMITIMGAPFVGLKPEEIPQGAGIGRMAQQIGGSAGTALLAVILQRTCAGARTPQALASGFGDAFWWAAAFTAAAVPLCLLLPGRPRPDTQVQDTMPAEQPTEA
ncbi:MDR family MFS transporter [Kitasatospora kifunensis]|uniref:EmrB/QacA subfamily drug resistance transporter n=1 Tax=Kitasatospora kifunensis TaxID=58351 RepID=A0A7W7RAG8_KITKI|nr:MDR family MFS transporter [Kitasatospora kifunensis]MBB4928402.1 EmrB/QacA subfamily drug resistance transporter [Kitasatospora kifunensis]